MRTGGAAQQRHADPEIAFLGGGPSTNPSDGSPSRASDAAACKTKKVHWTLTSIRVACARLGPDMREGEYFKPGDKVVRSGIYNVTHGGGHMPDHPVTCMFGKHFPKCDDCDDAARFTLISYAKDVDSEPCFKLAIGKQASSPAP